MACPKCYDCKYRGNVPGDTHSCCLFPGLKSGLFDFFEPENLIMRTVLDIRGDEQGIKNGWFFWPCNFDPAWLLNCKGFTPKEAA